MVYREIEGTFAHCHVVWVVVRSHCVIDEVGHDVGLHSLFMIEVQKICLAHIV